MFGRRRLMLRGISRVRIAVVATSLVAAGLAMAQARLTESGQALDLAGNPTDPLKLSAGKVVVLVFVRTDCPISNRYAPVIQQMSEHFTGRVAFWLLYPDKTESASSIRKHLRDYRYKLPALRDPQHVWVHRGHVSVTPEIAVFDAIGKLVYHGRIDNLYQGFGRTRSTPTAHELTDAVESTLLGRAPQTAETEAVGCYISDLE